MSSLGIPEQLLKNSMLKKPNPVPMGWEQRRKAGDKNVFANRIHATRSDAVTQAVEGVSNELNPDLDNPVKNALEGAYYSLPTAASIGRNYVRSGYLEGFNRLNNLFDFGGRPIGGINLHKGIPVAMSDPVSIHALDKVLMNKISELQALNIPMVLENVAKYRQKYMLPYLKTEKILGKVVPGLGQASMTYDLIGPGLNYRLHHLDELAQPRNDPDLNNNGY